MQPLLHVKWFHDSIIQPVEILTKHFIEDLHNWSKDKQKFRMMNYFKAVCLQHYLSHLSELSLPFILDKDPHTLIAGGRDTTTRVMLHFKNGDLKVRKTSLLLQSLVFTWLTCVDNDFIEIGRTTT